jgi:hypothetical protein
MTSLALEAQVVAVIDYMKVPENKDADYVAVEKQWKTLHQSRVESGKILTWHLWYVRNSGSGSPYNYVTATFYESFDKTGVAFTEDEFSKAFGDKADDFLSKTVLSRSLVCSETYHLQSSLEADVPDSKFIVLNWAKTDNVDNYIKMENVGFKPVHELAIKAGTLKSWQVWTRWPSRDNSFQAVVVNGYAKFEDIDNGVDYNPLIEQYLAGKKAAEILEITEQWHRTEEIRTFIKTEIWEYVDGTAPKK